MSRERAHQAERETGSTLAALVEAVGALAQAKEMGEVRAVVCRAARKITGANGATFVLRDGKQCHFAEEDATEPLWKGQFFPIDECISGWVMIYRQAVAISDIELDDRLHPDTYRSTFVKSMAMVPIRSTSPVGAIGTYWDTVHTPSKAEISALQSLADATAVTLENVSLNAYALNDSLSGLYNRRGFFTRGAERIGSNRQHEVDTTAIYVELGAVGQINDQFGHEAGDETIRRTGVALQSTCGVDAVIGRIAGDVYAICGPSNSFPSTDAGELEQAIHEATPESAWPVGLTVGVAVGGAGDDFDLDTLIAQANRAMYERKHGSVPPINEQVARAVSRD